MSAPSSADLSSGPITRAKPGRPDRMPGVSAHPGCMAWKTMPEPPNRRTHSCISTSCARLTLALERRSSA